MASTFRFVWDGNVLLHETFKKDNSENTELTTWVFEGFVPTAKLVNGKAYSIISDHLGTPILAVDSDGMEVWNRQLDIYGRVRKEYKYSSLGEEVFPFVPFLYQGQYYDFETGLCYNRFRYYSPETGSYISQDPIGLEGNNPNLYAYVEDSNWWVDRFGLDCSNYKARDINDEKNWNGCEKFAVNLQKKIGGDIHRIKPKFGSFLGGYRDAQPGWGHHDVVVKDGKVYDAFTGGKGESISEYKKNWQYSDDIDFGF